MVVREGQGYSRALQIVQKFHPNVTTVKDAKRHLHVDVTATDVRNSKPKDHAHCAMAVACRRKFNLDGMVVLSSTIYTVRGTAAIRYKAPSSIGREVTAFDRGAPFEPGQYHLSPPTYKLLTKMRPRAAAAEKKPRGKRTYRHYTKNVRAAMGMRDGNGRHS